MERSPAEIFAAALADSTAGRLESAQAGFQAVLAVAPDHIRSLGGLAGVLLRKDQPADALVHLERIIALNPNLAIAHADRALALGALARHEEALSSANVSLGLTDPPLSPALVAKGRALAGLGKLEDAIEAFDAAADLAEGPERAGVLAQAGELLAGADRPDEALTYFDAALACHPDAHELRSRRALIRLALGDFAGGWSDYEARWRRESFFANSTSPHLVRHFADRLLTSPSPADFIERRVLVLSEQGVGDEIMFASLLPELDALAAEVTYVCDPRLMTLLKTSMPTIEVVAGQGPNFLDSGRFDIVVGVGSLAAAFRRGAQAFSGRPYLRPREAIVEAWHSRLGPKQTPLRIGLSWRGGLARTNSQRRSMSLAMLAPILDHSSLEVVSLQYGDVAAELAEFNAGRARPIVGFPRAEINDFEQLGGLIRNLDMVVTVQTALVHLTGALGQRGLVMTPRPAEWRYGVAGRHMPWYASIELVRQPVPGEWAPVINMVREELDRAASSIRA